MARTRGAKGTAGKATKATKEETTTSSTSRYSLPAESTNPPKVLILPNKATSEARVVSLKNPRYSKPTRYLICPETGAYEFIKISAPKATPRSWFIESPSSETDPQHGTSSFETQVTKGADLYLATPIDPLFLALPALASQLAPTTNKKRMFLSSDDHLDTIADEQPHLRDTIVRWPAWRERFEGRMAVICDTVEGPGGGDELMFRLSEDKLLGQLLGKARRMSENGLPRSMEDKFVVKALEAPVLGVKKSNPGAVAVLKSEGSTLSESNGGDSQTESNESQSSVATTAATSVEDDDADALEALGIKDVASAIQASSEVVQLQRLRVAFHFLCSSYVPPSMAVVLKRMLLSSEVDVDFAPLDDYVARLAKLRQEALTARSAADYSRKRARDEEDDERREKKRKQEEEDKRKKAGESRGVRDLKKVNTSGMQKLSAFFKPKGS